MGFRVAIVGAPGLLTPALISVLDRRQFPIDDLCLYVEKPDHVSTVYRDHPLFAQPIPRAAFNGFDIAFLFAGSALSRQLMTSAAKGNCFIVDNSAYARARRDIPLVVPEVNPSAAQGTSIVANPTCTSIQLAAVLSPLDQVARVTKAIVATYQAVSGSGAPGLAALQAQVYASVADEPMLSTFYPDLIAFNVIPHIGEFCGNGSTSEETNMAIETARLLSSDIRISATCVRVPVRRAHSQVVHLETESHLSADRVHELLGAAPALRLSDSRESGGYPMPSTVTGEDLIYVGRIRESTASENGISLWSVMDQIYKGSVVNAVQIAELVANVRVPVALHNGDGMGQPHGVQT